MAGCSAGENQIVVEQQSRDGERWAEPAHRLEEQSHRQEEHFRNRVLCIFSCVLKVDNTRTGCSNYYALSFLCRNNLVSITLFTHHTVEH